MAAGGWRPHLGGPLVNALPRLAESAALTRLRSADFLTCRSGMLPAGNFENISVSKRFMAPSA